MKHRQILGLTRDPEDLHLGLYLLNQYPRGPPKFELCPHRVSPLLHSKTVLCSVAQSCPTLCDPTHYSLPGSSVHGESPGKNTGVGCHALLQGIFPTQGSNPGLPHCRRILYHLSHHCSKRSRPLAEGPPRGSGSSRIRTQTCLMSPPCADSATLLLWEARRR